MNQDFIVKSWIVERLSSGSKQVMFFNWTCPLCDKKKVYHMKVERTVQAIKHHLMDTHKIGLERYRDEKINFDSIKKIGSQPNEVREV